MSTSARVLIVTPVLRWFQRALASHEALIDAAPCRAEWLLLRHQRGMEEGARAVLLAWQTATERMRAGDYTHLLTLEDDMVVPPDALTKLLALDVPVAYGLYVWRRKPYFWNAYRTMSMDNGASWSYDQAHTAAQMLINAAPVQTQGLGNGCTLIKREVLDICPWRLDLGRAAPDWWFANDCLAAGIAQWHHFGVVCGHMTLLPSPRVLWPAVNQHDRADTYHQMLDLSFAPFAPHADYQQRIEI
jgi:hypothetical protein